MTLRRPTCKYCTGLICTHFISLNWISHTTNEMESSKDECLNNRRLLVRRQVSGTQRRCKIQRQKVLDSTDNKKNCAAKFFDDNLNAGTSAFILLEPLVFSTLENLFSTLRGQTVLDRSTILCLYVPGFQRQVFKHVTILSERSKRRKEQKKNKGSVLVAESADNAQNAQFGLVM